MQNKPNLVRRGGFQVYIWQALITNPHFCRKPKQTQFKPNQTQFLPAEAKNKPKTKPNLYRLGNLGNL
jgi:hypothetical protein